MDGDGRIVRIVYFVDSYLAGIVSCTRIDFQWVVATYVSAAPVDPHNRRLTGDS